MRRSQPCEELVWNVPEEGAGNAEAIKWGKGWLAQRQEGTVCLEHIARGGGQF